jgi:hypothetical protein
VIDVSGRFREIDEQLERLRLADAGNDHRQKKNTGKLTHAGNPPMKCEA